MYLSVVDFLRNFLAEILTETTVNDAHFVMWQNLVLLNFEAVKAKPVPLFESDLQRQITLQIWSGFLIAEFLSAVGYLSSNVSVNNISRLH